MLIGFAGLGRMGRPMAARLHGDGHTVKVYDPAPDDLPAGLTRVASPADLADAPVTISMLPDGATTRDLALTSLAGARRDHLHVIMGTVGPDLVRDVAREASFDVIDAPVSGSVSMAENGTITTMVGATPQQFDRIRPVLAAMTAAQFHVGPVGAGSTAKLAVNTVLVSLNEGIAEGLLVAEAGGLDLDALYGVLRHSAVAAPYVDYKQQAFLEPDAAGVAATVSLIRKDMGLGLDLARSHGYHLPASEAAYAVLDEATAEQRGDQDMAQVLSFLRSRSDRPEEEVAS